MQGSLIDAHTIQLVDADGKIITKTSEFITIAVGGRPRYPKVKNIRELAITSDDIFWLKKEPGKTLIIGASYVALECAGFLTSIENDCTVLVRSILLRGFDQQIATMIGDYMKNHNTKFIENATLSSIEKTSEGKLKCTFKGGKVKEQEYDTVLLAIGREIETANLNLKKAGVKMNKKGKVVTNDLDQTSVDNIFAIGDCASGVNGMPELTPVAIDSGKLLAKRLFAG